MIKNILLTALTTLASITVSNSYNISFENLGQNQVVAENTITNEGTITSAVYYQLKRPTPEFITTENGEITTIGFYNCYYEYIQADNETYGRVEYFQIFKFDPNSNITQTTITFDMLGKSNSNNFYYEDSPQIRRPKLSIQDSLTKLFENTYTTNDLTILTLSTNYGTQNFNTTYDTTTRLRATTNYATNTDYIDNYIILYYKFILEDGTTVNEVLTGVQDIFYQANITVNYTKVIENYSYEVLDIPGLIFTILGMPFAWISTAFNLTIFPGTPYELNIARLFLSIIAVLILIYIIKKVIK